MQKGKPLHEIKQTGDENWQNRNVENNKQIDAANITSQSLS